MTTQHELSGELSERGEVTVTVARLGIAIVSDEM